MEPQPAQQWEYLAVPFKDGGDLKKNSEGLSPKRLNELGAQGWEFEKLLTDMALHGEKDGHVLIFKRETGA